MQAEGKSGQRDLRAASCHLCPRYGAMLPAVPGKGSSSPCLWLDLLSGRISPRFSLLSVCPNICVFHLGFGLQTFLIPTVPWGEICLGGGGDVGHPSCLSSPAFPIAAAACTWDSLARHGCKHGAAAPSTGVGTQPHSPERSVVEELLRNSLDKAYGKQGTALRTDWGGVQPRVPALQGLLVQC